MEERKLSIKRVSGFLLPIASEGGVRDGTWWRRGETGRCQVEGERRRNEWANGGERTRKQQRKTLFKLIGETLFVRKHLL